MRVRALDPDPERSAALYPRWNLGNRRRETALALACAHARSEGRSMGYVNHPEAAWAEAHARYVGRLLEAILGRVVAPAPLKPSTQAALDWSRTQPWRPPDAAHCAREREDYLRRYGPGRGTPPRVLPEGWPDLPAP